MFSATVFVSAFKYKIFQYRNLFENNSVLLQQRLDKHRFYRRALHVSAYGINDSKIQFTLSLEKPNPKGVVERRDRQHTFDFHTNARVQTGSKQMAPILLNGQGFGFVLRQNIGAGFNRSGLRKREMLRINKRQNTIQRIHTHMLLLFLIVGAHLQFYQIAGKIKQLHPQYRFGRGEFPRPARLFCYFSGFSTVTV